MKLAINGGKKTRSKSMPSRFSFGPKENLEIKKMFALNFLDLWVVDILMQLQLEQELFMLL